jgi:hypothetical protein
VGRAGLGQLAGVPGPVLKQVGNAQGGDHPEGVREIVGGRHLVEEDLRRELGWSGLVLGGHVALPVAADESRARGRHRRKRPADLARAFDALDLAVPANVT